MTESTQSPIKETKAKVGAFLDILDDHINNDDFDAKKDSLDFLDVKNSLMLSYLIDLTNLIRLTTKNKKGSNDDEHSLNNNITSSLTRLNEMRIALDKTRPLEKKLRYQIDKLLTLQSSSSFASVGDGEVSQPSQGVGDDPLSFRPDPSAMLSGDDEANDPPTQTNDPSDSDEDEDKELHAAKASIPSDTIYKPPRHNSVQFPADIEKLEKQRDREERTAQRQRDRMRRSELLRTLQSQYTDMPEEDDAEGGATFQQRDAAQRLARREAEKVEFEESAMVRLVTSRKDKKERKKIMRQEMSNLNAISDLGNLASGIAAFGEGSKRDGRFENNVDDGRYDNGKRKRGGGMEGVVRQKKKGSGHTNALQSALYGMEGGKKKGKKKR